MLLIQKNVFIYWRHISALLFSRLLAFAIPFNSDYDWLKWNDAIKSGFTIVFSFLRSSGHRISVGPLSGRDWLTCHPSPPVSLFLSASLREYLWYTLILGPIIRVCVECLDWPAERKHVDYVSGFENGALWMPKLFLCSCHFPLLLSLTTKLSALFPSFPFPSLLFFFFFFFFLTLFLSIRLLRFSLDLSAPPGWWMCLISHLDLSTITSHTLCLSCSCSLDMHAEWKKKKHTHSSPLCALCLMLSLWTGDLASMGSIPGGHTVCVWQTKRGRYSEGAHTLFLMCAVNYSWVQSEKRWLNWRRQKHHVLHILCEYSELHVSLSPPQLWYEQLWRR